MDEYTPVPNFSPTGIAVSPNGNYLYVATNTYNGGNGLVVYDISSVGIGTLTQIASSPFGTGAYPVGIAASPNGNYLFVANAGISGASTISAFSITPTTGGLSSTSTFSISGLQEIAISPNSSYLYVTSNAGISAYSIGAGANTLPLIGKITGPSIAYGIAIMP